MSWCFNHFAFPFAFRNFALKSEMLAAIKIFSLRHLSHFQNKSERRFSRFAEYFFSGSVSPFGYSLHVVMLID